MAHRLAAGLTGFQTLTVTLAADGSGEFDAAAGLAIRRVGARRAPRSARNVLLNVEALRRALRFRPQAILSLHIVASPAAWTVGRLLGVPVVQYYHAKEIPARPRLAAFAATHADVVLAVSEYCAQLIRATGARPPDMRLIPPGVDLPDVSLAAGREHDRPTIVTIARLEDRYKGHDVMLRALPLVRERVPDVRWVVVGDGSLRPELERRAMEAGLGEAVRFLGAVSDADRDAWLRGADLLAMPSRLPEGGQAGEGFGIAFMEAAAYGKPVVAGNVGGALDSVLDGETGLLVDPCDPGAVAEAIVRLLGDEQLAGRLGAAGAARARTFAWPATAARVEAVLMEQIELRARRGAAGGSR